MQIWDHRASTDQKKKKPSGDPHADKKCSFVDISNEIMAKQCERIWGNRLAATINLSCPFCRTASTINLSPLELLQLKV